MEILMNAAEVVGYFPTTERVREDLVDDSKILLAQIKFLLPVLGRSVVDELSTGDYTSYLDKYIKPPLATLVRYLVMEQVVAQVGVMGVQQFSSDMAQIASVETISRLGATLRSHALTLLGEAVVALEDYDTLKSLYDSENHGGRVGIKAGFIL